MSPETEFELRRILFACLTIISSIYGIFCGILFYDWRVDPFWFASTTFLPVGAILVQNIWSLYQVTRPENVHIYDIWWNDLNRATPRKRIALSFILCLGYLSLHHDMRKKRHEYDALLVQLTAIHTCIHWVPVLLFQIYITTSVHYFHLMQLLYMILLGVCIVIFITLVLRRYTQYFYTVIFLWATFKLMSTIFPVAIFSTLRSNRFSDIYKVWGFLWIVPVGIQIILYILAKHLTWTKLEKRCRCLASTEKKRSLRLGTVLILIWSVIMWVMLTGMMGKWIHKTANDSNSTSNSTVHQGNCKGMLKALQNSNCTFLKERLQNPKADCIGSPVILSHCSSFSGPWLPSLDYTKGATPFVFAGLMMFLSLVTSEFFLVAILMLAFKGKDDFIKFRPKSGARVKDEKQNDNKPAPGEVQEEQSTPLLSSEPAAAPVNEGATQLEGAVARFDFGHENVTIKKGDKVEVVERVQDMWKVKIDAVEVNVHRGVFEEVADFALDKCRALYDYDPDFDSEDAASGDDLRLEYNDEVLIYLKPEGKEWWFGQVGNETGWVPKNFLEMIH